MLISKFDLYRPEWLELVFDNRNKAYGAYELRRQHARTMITAMALTFITIGVFFGISKVLQATHKTGPLLQDHVIQLTQPTDLPKPPPVIPKLPKAPAPPVATIKFVPMVVKPDKLAEEPPKIEELNVAISTTTNKGAPGEQPLPTIDEGTGSTPNVTEDITVHNVYDVQVMPSPVGGEDAWSKFLNKNLRFPAAAQEDGASGRVFMSFIVEKDGTLSNISVERPAGHGFDEEAARVLKLAKAWKPGIQNGKPVRVKFIIPINFTISDPQ